MLLPPLSPLMRTVLIRFDSETTKAETCAFFSDEGIRQAEQRARQVLEALCNVGTHHLVGRIYCVTPRGERVRDQLLSDLAATVRPARRRT